MKAACPPPLRLLGTMEQVLERSFTLAFSRVPEQGRNQNPTRNLYTQASAKHQSQHLRTSCARHKVQGNCLNAEHNNPSCGNNQHTCYTINRSVAGLLRFAMVAAPAYVQLTTASIATPPQLASISSSRISPPPAAGQHFSQHHSRRRKVKAFNMRHEWRPTQPTLYTASILGKSTH